VIAIKHLDHKLFTNQVGSSSLQSNPLAHARDCNPVRKGGDPDGASIYADKLAETTASTKTLEAILGRHSVRW
jgi:hypothetical protein